MNYETALFFHKMHILSILFVLLTGFIIPLQSSIPEAEKTEKLISYVQNLKGCSFIRNGTAYTPVEAAEHLRLKLKKGAKNAATAQAFIDNLASYSSYSGEPYRIKFANGKTYPIKPFLQQELKRIENRSKPNASN